MSASTAGRAKLAAHRPVVIFDLDGTLVDSAPGIAAALNATGLGARRVAVDIVRSLVSFGVERLVRDALDVAEGDVQRAVAAFRAIYAEAPCALQDLYPGAREVLLDLHRRGAACGVCTNKPQRLADLVIARLGLTELIPVVVGTAPGRPAKPDPAPLLEAMARLSAEGKAVLVGDSHVDAATADAAAVPFIFASYGYGCYGPEHGSAGTIGALPDLLPLLDRLRWFPEEPPRAASDP